MNSQTMSRSQLSTGNENISNRQKVDTEEWNQRHERAAERSGRVGIAAPHDQHGCADDGECEQCADILEFGKYAQRQISKRHFSSKNRAFSFGGSVVSASI